MQELEYVEIESIECVGYENTYDIEMEEWPSFIANGFVVHNSGMKNLLKEMAMGSDLTFDDLAAATALFRPGPLDAGLCERYVQVKQGASKPYYEHPRLEPILSNTLGVMAYQEQTMMVARELSGFSPGDADLLRKAISKKDAAKMAELGGQFIEGAVAGYASVELDDGSVVQVHLRRKLKVKENDERWTIEQIHANGFEIAEAL